MREDVEEQEKQLRKYYREVFKSDMGQKVLFSILEDLGYFAEAQTQDRVALKNYATFLIRKRIGVNDAQGMMAVVKMMLSQGK